MKAISLWQPHASLVPLGLKRYETRSWGTSYQGPLVICSAKRNIEMFTINIDYFLLKPVELPKTTILLDNGYHPDKLEAALVKIYPEIMTKIQFELSPKPSKEQKAQEGKSGFVPVKVRWVIERSNSWMERCKSLVKNFERTLANATTKIHLCFVRLMLRRLATS